MSKHKLLLADDSVTIQKVVNLTFADEGIEVISVGDGNSAMEKFVESTPDLVMVDVHMPGVDGYRICEIIKQDETTKHIPVILLVGSFEPFDEEEARRVGANDYLTKPFQSIRQLVNKVTILLNKSNDGNVPASPSAEVPPAANPVQTPVQEVYKPYVDRQSEEISEPATYKQAEEKNEPLGDPGMDDEMIQANQIGSLPVDDIQKLESNVTNFEDNLPQNRLQNPYSDQASNVQNFDSAEDFGKTQPLSADEFKELTTPPATEKSNFETTLPTYAGERVSAEERAMSLEKQMVSEFESEAKSMSSEFESQAKKTFETPVEMPSSQPIVQEETFVPEEIPFENQPTIEEIPEEKGFEIQQVEEINKNAVDELIPQSLPVAENEPILEDLYNAPEDNKTEELAKEEYYSEPKLAEVEGFSKPETLVPPVAHTPIKPFNDEILSPEQESAETIPSETGDFVEPKEETSSLETAVERPSFQAEVVENPSFGSSEPESEKNNAVVEQPTYFQDERAFDELANLAETQRESEPETFSEDEQSSSEPAKLPESIQFYPVEQFFERDKPSEIYDDKSEAQKFYDSNETEPESQSESKYVEPEIEVEPSYTESEKSNTEFENPEKTEPETGINEKDSTQESKETIEEAEQIPTLETSTPTIEIPAPFPTIEEVMPQIEEEDEPLEINDKAAAAEKKTETLVSKKDANEAVESVIVSEFARHSISLSSEAVEKIATKIADRISEKIIERMADDVVGSLADRIVEKMERKKLE